MANRTSPEFTATIDATAKLFFYLTGKDPSADREETQFFALQACDIRWLGNILPIGMDNSVVDINLRLNAADNSKTPSSVELKLKRERDDKFKISTHRVVRPRFPSFFRGSVIEEKVQEETTNHGVKRIDDDPKDSPERIEDLAATVNMLKERFISRQGMLLGELGYSPLIIAKSVRNWLESVESLDGDEAMMRYIMSFESNGRESILNVFVSPPSSDEDWLETLDSLDHLPVEWTEGVVKTGQVLKRGGSSRIEIDTNESGTVTLSTRLELAVEERRRPYLDVQISRAAEAELVSFDMVHRFHDFLQARAEGRAPSKSLIYASSVPGFNFDLD